MRTIEKKNRSYIVAITGASGCGKTTFVNLLAKRLWEKEKIKSTKWTLDHYYLPLRGKSFAERAKTNFDHPDALDWDLMCKHLKKLKNGESIMCPYYDFSINTTIDEKSFKIKPEKIIFFEGIHTLHNPQIRKNIDISVFVKTDPDICLCRRILRDIQERGRTPEFCINQYQATVKPMYEKYIMPNMKYADIIVPEGGKNKITIGIIKEALIQISRIFHENQSE